MNLSEPSHASDEAYMELIVEIMGRHQEKFKKGISGPKRLTLTHTCHEEFNQFDKVISLRLLPLTSIVVKLRVLAQVKLYKFVEKI